MWKRSCYISVINEYFCVVSFAIWNTHIIVNFSCISCFELMLCSVELIHSWDLVEFFKTLKFAQKGNWGACPKQLRHPKAVIRHTTKGNFASHDRFITLFSCYAFLTSTILRYLRYRKTVVLSVTSITSRWRCDKAGDLCKFLLGQFCIMWLVLWVCG